MSCRGKFSFYISESAKIVSLLDHNIQGVDFEILRENAKNAESEFLVNIECENCVDLIRVIKLKRHAEVLVLKSNHTVY